MTPVNYNICYKNCPRTTKRCQATLDFKGIRAALCLRVAHLAMRIRKGTCHMAFSQNCRISRKNGKRSGKAGKALKIHWFQHLTQIIIIPDYPYQNDHKCWVFLPNFYPIVTPTCFELANFATTSEPIPSYPRRHISPCPLPCSRSFRTGPRTSRGTGILLPRCHRCTPSPDPCIVL